MVSLKHPKSKTITESKSNTIRHITSQKLSDTYSRMSGDNDEKAVEIYIYRGDDEDEQVPPSTEKLIVHEGLKMVPAFSGLIVDTAWAPCACENLLEICIPSSVEFIMENAFQRCQKLAKVEFSSIIAEEAFGLGSFLKKRLLQQKSVCAGEPHRLRAIYDGAFSSCHELFEIRLPSSLAYIGHGAFDHCHSLIDMDLSTTRVTGILCKTFWNCHSLQTVSLPNTVHTIGQSAFLDCSDLVRVAVPLDSKAISIEARSFRNCSRLAILKLPKYSTAEDNSFKGCKLLRKRYGKNTSGILAGLVTL